MFGVRLVSSIMIMALTILSMVLGGTFLWGVLLVISLIGMWELYRAVGMHKSIPAVLGYLACIGYDIIVYLNQMEAAFPLFVLFLLVLMASYVFSFPRYQAEQIGMIFLGLFYVAVMLSFIYRVRIVPSGAFFVWLIFIGSWGSDCCAYCVGMLIGKHRLPGHLKELSPKKSIEGCIGGVAGAALIGFIYGSVVGSHLPGLFHPGAACAIIGAASAVISQIGDLAASAIKRNHNIKDYSRLIPGHGGILDRFDAVIFTAPIVFLLVEALSR
ncbi:phosphatidate cytidylyltransferase [Anaerolentibacter hominis]|uniref:phosphatidate cytidylyltransferase n=1 Tax=Anaerolentibacter hominis TaxID=3079009 RepID=UPI0031B8A344